jgi:hypothetical protein
MGFYSANPASLTPPQYVTYLICPHIPRDKYVPFIFLSHECELLRVYMNGFFWGHCKKSDPLSLKLRFWYQKKSAHIFLITPVIIIIIVIVNVIVIIIIIMASSDIIIISTYFQISRI